MKKVEIEAMTDTVTTHLGTLNFDTRISHPIPAIGPGEKGVLSLIRELRKKDFTYLAFMIDYLYKGERGEDKQIPNTAEAPKLESDLSLIGDLRLVISENALSLKNTARVGINEYARGVTNGAIILTWYEMMAAGDIGSANHRLETISKQPGIKLSPLMIDMLGEETLKRQAA